MTEQQLALNACQAGRCAELVDRKVLFCDRHYAMIPDVTRTALLVAYRPGRPPTGKFLHLLEFARAEIRYFEQTGARVPTDRRLFE